MFYKKKGIPEEGEIILCTVKKILSHSVFVTLDEYENKEGMIHISEVSPGRIRNLRDFVREGKTIVCKTLRINREKGHIDLSLRRVPLSARKKKEEEQKQEQKAEKLIELVIKDLKISLEDFYKKAGYEILEKYGLLNEFFKQVLTNEKEVIQDLQFDKKILNNLVKKIKEKIKLPEAKVESIISMSSNHPDGIERIKKTLKKTLDFAKQKDYNLKIIYISAPKYNIAITTSDYKKAEKIMKEITENIEQSAKQQEIEVTWQKKS